MTDHRLARRDLLKATGAVAIGAGAVTQTATAQSAEGPTVYVGSSDSNLYAVGAATGSQEWAFTQPSVCVRSSPTMVANPQDSDSVGSRVRLGTLGHHGNRARRCRTAAGTEVYEGVSFQATICPYCGKAVSRPAAVIRSMTFIVHFSEPHLLTDGDETELEVSGYEDVGSMYILELTDGGRRSAGKQLVDEITESTD